MGATSALLAVAIALAQAAAGAPAAHTREFWRQIADAKYAPPPGADLAALTGELTGLLASPDPELRDEIAYSTLAAWIYQQRRLDGPATGTLAGALIRNLQADVGSVGSDAVLRRSFSALTLSVVAARDNVEPVLTDAGYRELLDAALTYLAAERDVRGYDETRGWMHSAAHTADLLKFLGRNRRLAPADAPRILDAIARKLGSSPVLTFGEDERFARAALSIVNRSDFDREAFAAWAAKSKPLPVRAARPTIAQLNGAQNLKNFFAKLEVLLGLDATPSDAARAARDAVRAALADAY